MGKMNALTRGIVIFAVLAVITIIEYVIGVREAPVAVMAILALLKAGLVAWYFMHVGRVFNASDEGDHS
jgi:heme/copper-type cytochrome/quinol oxidase subunit 4